MRFNTISWAFCIGGKLSFFFLIMAFGINSFAQEGRFNQADRAKDSIKQRMRDSIVFSYMAKAALKYPSIRQIDISTETFFHGDLDAKLNGKDWFKGKIAVYRNTANFNIPVLSWKKSSIQAQFGALYQHLQVTDIYDGNNSQPMRKSDLDNTSIHLGTRYNRTDSLFNIPVNFNLGVSSVIDQSFTKSRFMYTGVVIFQILRTPKTALSAGVVVSSNPSSFSPIMPLISYSHQFNALGLELFIDIPTRIMLRKELGAKSSLSIGIDTGETLSFLNLNYSTLPRDVIYSTIEVKQGIKYEYQISRKAVLSISTGLLSTYSADIIKRNDYQMNKILENKIGDVSYVNISISFLPFLRGCRL